MSAKQHQFLSSGLPTDPTNSQKSVSNFSSTWLAHQTMAFLTGQPLHAPKSWYTAGGPMSHSLPTEGLSVAKAASSQLGFLTQLCFIFNDICVSHLPSPTSLCAINKLQGLELTEPLFQQPPRVTLSYGLVPQGDWPNFRLQYLLDWNR